MPVGFPGPSKRVLIALPVAMVDALDDIANKECRTRSDMVRETIRRYIDGFRNNQTGSAVIASTPPPVATV